MKTVNHYVRPLLTATLIGLSSLAQADIGPAEKPDLKLGFIKLTDMAPLAVAWEQGYFMDEGLFVELEAQANWKCCWTGSSPVNWMVPTCWPANLWGHP